MQTRCFTLTALSHEKTEVVEDTTPPVITVSGVPTEGTVGEKVILPPATVTDDLDSGLTEKISVKGPTAKSVAVVNNSFTPQEAGTYTIVYSASDSAGNKAQDRRLRSSSRQRPGGGCGSSFAAGRRGSGARMRIGRGGARSHRFQKEKLTEQYV